MGGRDAAPNRVDIVQALGEPLVPDTLALGRGPRAALQVWQGERRSIAETRLWMEEARMEAVLGSCKGSLPSVRLVCKCSFCLAATCMVLW